MEIKVAKALWAWDTYGLPLGHKAVAGDPKQETDYVYWLEYAHIAIRAMRDVTEEMFLAQIRSRGPVGTVLARKDIEQGFGDYIAMIDAAAPLDAEDSVELTWPT